MSSHAKASTESEAKLRRALGQVEMISKTSATNGTLAMRLSSIHQVASKALVPDQSSLKDLVAMYDGGSIRQEDFINAVRRIAETPPTTPNGWERCEMPFANREDVLFYDVDDGTMRNAQVMSCPSLITIQVAGYEQAQQVPITRLYREIKP